MLEAQSPNTAIAIRVVGADEVEAVTRAAVVGDGIRGGSCGGELRRRLFRGIRRRGGGRLALLETDAAALLAVNALAERLQFFGGRRFRHFSGSCVLGTEKPPAQIAPGALQGSDDKPQLLAATGRF